MVARTVSRMTDSEILTLSQIYNIVREPKTAGANISRLAQDLTKKDEEIELIIDGLLQQEVILESSLSSRSFWDRSQPINKRQGFYFLSQLGKRIVVKCKEIKL